MQHTHFETGRQGRRHPRPLFHHVTDLTAPLRASDDEWAQAAQMISRRRRMLLVQRALRVWDMITSSMTTIQ